MSFTHPEAGASEHRASSDHEPDDQYGRHFVTVGITTNARSVDFSTRISPFV